MIDIGSCGLHVVNGAFKHGSDASNWDVPSVLRSVHSLFNETPASREDCTRVTDSDQSGLPLERGCMTGVCQGLPTSEASLPCPPVIMPLERGCMTRSYLE